jgi:hypothetical protein
MMEDVPEELQNHILAGFYIRKGRMNHAMGLELHSGHGSNYSTSRKSAKKPPPVCQNHPECDVIAYSF